MFSLVVVDYKSLGKSIDFVEKFLSQVKDRDIISPIVVDNSPKTQTDEFVKSGYVICGKVNVNERQVELYQKDYYKIAYCFAGENMGYAKGNNLGTIISDEIFDNPYYVISNNDINLPELLDTDVFVSIFEKFPDVAVIGPKVIGKDGKPQSPHKRVSAFTRLIAYYWLCRWPFRWKPDYDFDDKSKICYRVMGSFMIIKRDPFIRVSRFDPNTFMFAEEPILSERLHKFGYKTFYYNDWMVIHEHGASVSKVSSQLISEQWAFDSCLYYFEKYRNTGKVLVWLSKVNFFIYKVRLRLRLCVKKWIKRI